MYVAQFIFEPTGYDEEFHRLDAEIQKVAESIIGYVGMEFWQSADGKQINAIYYWQTEASLHQFASHPKHKEAIAKYSQWYKGYHIVISKILHSYGDGNLLHLTPNQRFIK